MSSVNPVVILPEALQTSERTTRHRVARFSHAWRRTVLYQPRLGLLQAGADADALIARLGELLSGTAEQTMLTPGISSSYQKGVSTRFEQTGVAAVMQKSAAAKCGAAPALFRIDAPGYLCQSNAE